MHLSEKHVERAAHDWLLWTDGSGHHADGIWASASRFVSGRQVRFRDGRPDRPPGSTVAGGNNGSVNRAELMALLEGLHAIYELERKAAGGGAGWKPGWPIRLKWFSDRENLVTAATRKHDGSPACARDADADLWQAVGWYEKFFQIEAVHTGRNTLAQQKACDKLCGVARRTLKTWLPKAVAKHLLLPEWRR